MDLKPRTRPIDSVGEEAEDAGGARESIFGGAKPVDTAQKEKEVEERILKENEEIHKKVRYPDDRVVSALQSVTKRITVCPISV